MRTIPALLVAAGMAASPVARTVAGPRVSLVDPDGPPVGTSSLPVPDTAVTPVGLRAPHHDYPAADLMVPLGTPVFAVRAGFVDVHDGERCGLGATVMGADGY